MMTTDRIKLLLELGEAGRGGDWPDYLQYGFVETDVPALLDLVADEAFDQASSDSAGVWAPLHAWRTLGQLGSGKAAMDELFNQTRGIFTNKPVSKTKNKFTKQIAFNVIPHIDKFMDDGSTKEEWKMVAETKKILDPAIKVTATCVRVPVFIGHGEAINLEFENPIDEDEARAALKNAPGVTVIDHRQDEGYVTPAECAGEDAVFVSRLRTDPTVDNGLSLWVVSDNLRKGAALNTVQIGEALVADYLSK